MKFKMPVIQITEDAKEVLATSLSVFLAISITQLVLGHSDSIIRALIAGVCTFGVVHVIWKNLSKGK